MIFYNGKYANENKLRISPLNESYMRGYGVFQTLRTYDGEIFCLEKHVDALFRSAELICLDHSYKKDRIMDWTGKTFKKSGLKEARIKIVLTETELLIWPQKLMLRPKSWYRTGIKVVTYPIERLVPESKHMNCLSSVLAQKWAKKHKVYEAFMIDRDGILREGAYSNVFWVKKGVLYTTKKEVLQGITRGIVLKMAGKIMKVREEDWSLRRVMGADEVFLTNTTSEVLPVVGVDGRRIGVGEVGEWTGRLMSLWENNSY